MMTYILYILSWLVANESFTSGSAVNTRTFKFVFFGGRVSFVSGYHGNCTTGLFLHWGGTFGHAERMRHLLIRTGRHTETDLYFRFGQPVFDHKTKTTRRAWGIDMNSVHLMRLVLRLTGKRLTGNGYDDCANRWMGFEYSRSEHMGNVCEDLHFFGYRICLYI